MSCGFCCCCYSDIAFAFVSHALTAGEWEHEFREKFWPLKPACLHRRRFDCPKCPAMIRVGVSLRRNCCCCCCWSCSKIVLFPFDQPLKIFLTVLKLVKWSDWDELPLGQQLADNPIMTQAEGQEKLEKEKERMKEGYLENVKVLYCILVLVFFFFFPSSSFISDRQLKLWFEKMQILCLSSWHKMDWFSFDVATFTAGQADNWVVMPTLVEFSRDRCPLSLAVELVD